MVQKFTKSPLQKKTTNAWVIFKKKTQQAWALLPKNQKIIFEQGSAAQALVKKVQTALGVVQEIPDHYLCIESGLDLQTHLRFPGQEERETLEGGIEAAISGGYDALVTMPNTQPFLDSPKILKQAIIDCEKRMENYKNFQVYFTASATIGMEGKKAAPIEKLVEAGAVAITNDGWGVFNDEAMNILFASCAQMGVPYMQHAEAHGHKGIATSSAFQKKSKLPIYPRTVESEMIARDLAVLSKNKRAHYHVLHISTRESIECVRKAKEAGLNVTAEVTPHHLFFVNSEIPTQSDPRSTFFKMNPPLFAPEDREALQQALQEGIIDCVSTDHAPHELSAKQRGWELAPFGTRGLEATIPVLITLMKDNKLSLDRISQVFSKIPRKIINQKASKNPQAILCIDPKQEFIFNENDMPGISKNSCFLGAKLYGRIQLRAELGVIYERQ